MASTMACAIFEWLWPPNRNSGHQYIRNKPVQDTHDQSIAPMKLPAPPPKVLSSDSCQCPSQLGTIRVIENQCYHPMDKILWIESYRGITYGTLTGATPVVLAKARTHFHPKGVLVYCSLETYEEAPNSMAAAREVGEDWDWVKEKYREMNY